MLLLVTLSCHHNNNSSVPQPTGGIINFKITNRMNGQNLNFNQKYITPLEDTITINDYKYYISNIQLISSNGNYIVPASYYLIDVSKGSTDTIVISNVPAGSYTQINFSIGIDSAVNSSAEIQTEPVALDPTVNAEMNWGWGPGFGYKFLLLQGNFYDSATTPPTSPFLFHIADNNNYKIKSFNSTTPNWSAIVVQTGKTSEININFNLDSLFKGINLYSEYSVTSPQSEGVTIANNYSDMPQLMGIINP